MFQELRFLRYIHNSDPNSPVYFVRMPSELRDSLGNGDSSDLDTRLNGSCSPQLYNQLRNFFNDNGGQTSDATICQQINESDQSSIEDINVIETPVPNNSSPLVVALSDSDQDAAGANVSTFNKAANVEPDDKTIELKNFADVGLESLFDTKNVSPTNSDCELLPTVIEQGVDRPVIDIENESSVLTVCSEIVEGLYDGFNAGLATFVRNVLQSRVVSTVALLHAVHRRCLELMISSAYDMQWDTMCTPTRLKFAREKEVGFENVCHVFWFSLMRTSKKLFV